MGKFDGVLLCTDLDDTLLTHDKRVSDKNINAINYFTENGGMFTFGTGRVPRGLIPILKYIRPSVPFVGFNGAAIYDLESEKFLWSAELDADAVKVLEYVDKFLPYAGIEVTTASAVYFNKVNHIVAEHQVLENFPDNFCDYHDIKEPYMKTIFMVESWELEDFKAAIQATDFPKRYSFIQSSPQYYELLPYGCTKGSGLIRLRDMVSARFTVSAGDTENDIALVRAADFGVAVSNAIPAVKAAADYVTEHDNNHSAIAEIIEMLDDGRIDCRK